MIPIGEKFSNPVKHRLQSGEKLLGAWAQLCSPVSAEILARAGFDFLLIDMEHTPGDTMVLMSQMHAMGRYPAAPIVRVPWNDAVTIKRVLDAGAYGVHVPYVNTVKEAQAAVSAVKYPPLGVRGAAGSPRACGYGIGGKDYFERANDEILLYIAMETPQAIDNLDEMLKVEGVDGIFVGPMDLSASLGHIGDTKHPLVLDAFRRIEEKTLGSGKFLGTISGDYEEAQEYFARGYQYVVAFSDSISLSKSSRGMVERFRKDHATEQPV